MQLSVSYIVDDLKFHVTIRITGTNETVPASFACYRCNIYPLDYIK